MKKVHLFLLGTTLSLCLEAQTPVVLNSASSFAVLAGSTVTNTGPSVVNGNLGVSAGTAVAGFPPGSVINGAIHAADATAAAAQSDLTTAFNDAAGRPCPGGNVLPGDIGGMTLSPGVYCTASSLGITGTLTLNGQGNSGSVFIFQIGSALTTATANSAINLINGAVAANVFWVIGSSATLGTSTFFSGTILAQASITLTTGAVLNGRALARIGAVTLDTSSVTNPGPPAATGAPLTLTCAFGSGQIGQQYTSALVASGGLAPYTFSITTGSLPAGLTLNPSTGAVTGRPTTAGTTNYTARVTDSATTAVTVNCGGITISPQAALTLACAFPNGQVGQPYVSALIASGGVSPYTFSISAGALPAGLSLNTSTGAITGTPTTAGIVNYTAHVVDSAAGVATSNCGGLSISPAAPPGTPAPPTLLLLAAALACLAVYQWRGRLLQLLRGS